MLPSKTHPARKTATIPPITETMGKRIPGAHQTHRDANTQTNRLQPGLAEAADAAETAAEAAAVDHTNKTKPTISQSDTIQHGQKLFSWKCTPNSM